MLEAERVEEIVCLVSAMDRAAVTERLLSFCGEFPVDFTPDFLARLPDDRLKHILLALCLQTRRRPMDAISEAA